MNWFKRWIEKVRVALQWKDYEIDARSIHPDKRIFVVQADGARMAIESDTVPKLGELLPWNDKFKLVSLEASPMVGNIWNVVAVYEPVKEIKE